MLRGAKSLLFSMRPDDNKDKQADLKKAYDYFKDVSSLKSKMQQQLLYFEQIEDHIKELNT